MDRRRSVLAGITNRRVYFSYRYFLKMSSSSNFGCEYPECDNEYGSYNNLLRHYRANKQHKPDNSENKKVNAKELVSDVFLPSSISEMTRSARIKAFISCLSVEEKKEHFVDAVLDHVSPLEFLVSKATTRNGIVDTTKLLRDFDTLKELLCVKYPEMKLSIEGSVGPNVVGIPSLNDMVNFVKDNKTLVCDALLEADNGKIFRERLMPMLFESNKDSFLEFAS